MDLILVVEDPVQFHKENSLLNWKHYSTLKYLGPKSLATIQDRWGARVYFNTLVPYEYGVCTIRCWSRFGIEMLGFGNVILSKI